MFAEIFEKKTQAHNRRLNDCLPLQCYIEYVRIYRRDRRKKKIHRLKVETVAKEKVMQSEFSATLPRDDEPSELITRYHAIFFIISQIKDRSHIY